MARNRGERYELDVGAAHSCCLDLYQSVGLVGSQIEIPLFPFVDREFTYHGSFWGNYSDLSEVIALAQQAKIRHAIKRVQFKDINENLELLRDGDIVGRAVVTFGAEADAPTESRAAERAVAV